MIWSLRNRPTPRQGLAAGGESHAVHRGVRRLGHHFEYIRRHGLLGFCEFTAYRLTRRLVRVRAFRVMELRPANINAAALQLPAGFTARALGVEELRRLAPAFPEPPSIAFVEAAILKGDVCVAVFHEGHPVCTGWYARRPTQLFDGLAVRFGDDAIYAYKIYTAGSHRGQRLMALNQAHALRQLQPTPRRLLSCIETSNRASLRSTEWLGARCIGTFGYWQGSELTIGYTSPRCRRAPFAVQAL
ncbi:MAG: hypothetical protein IT480_13310 [Gammaproteobacteria bacterium]|nr:hypothetical protein [Gammaproteobacteria bacterium]